jgi:hypothetical protein
METAQVSFTRRKRDTFASTGITPRNRRHRFALLGAAHG